jgi:hypothetical protein
MPTLNQDQIVALLQRVGFKGESLNIAQAVARGESGWRTDAKGDIDLQNEKWGPSIGLFQVRCLWSEVGKGTPRDCSRLTDPEFNARAAYEISSGGQNWQPWTVFKTGTYKKYLTDVTTSIQKQIESLFVSPIRSITPTNIEKYITTQYGAAKAIGEGAHFGIDLSAVAGTPIVAPRSGVVTRKYYESAGGNVMVLDHGNGLETIFAHAERYSLNVGDTFKTGDVVGYVGSTGKVTGAHLHWETKLDGKPINPLDLFDPFAMDFNELIPGFEGIKADIAQPTPWTAAFETVTAIPRFIFTLGAFLFDPKNWAALLALLTGLALLIVGGRMVWSAV